MSTKLTEACKAPANEAEAGRRQPERERLTATVKKLNTLLKKVNDLKFKEAIVVAPFVTRISYCRGDELLPAIAKKTSAVEELFRDWKVDLDSPEKIESFVTA